MPHPAANPDDLLRLTLVNHAVALRADYDRAWTIADEVLRRWPQASARVLGEAVATIVADDESLGYFPELTRRITV